MARNARGGHPLLKRLDHVIGLEPESAAAIEETRRMVERRGMFESRTTK
jgi:hypothetical protein